MAEVKWGASEESQRAIATASELYLFLSGVVNKITYVYAGAGASKYLFKKKFWKGVDLLLELTYTVDGDFDVTVKEKTVP